MQSTTQARSASWLQAAFASLAIVALALFALASMPVHAAAPAGSVIGNQATATYTDAGGIARAATSNLVQTTVSQVKSFTLNTTPQARTAAPGQTVYYPHYITNTGNGTDTYTLVAPVSGAFAGTPGGPHTALAYYIDANGDGTPDNATPITTTGPLAANGIFRFVVAGTVPASANDTATAQITVEVTDTGGNSAQNFDTTTVANSVITVTKGLSVTSGPSPSVGQITVTLSYTNSGTAAATNVAISDQLPAGMTYVAGSGLWSVSGATVLTDAADGAEQGGPNGVNYSFAAGSGPSGTVAATIGQVNPGVSGTVTFRVTVNAGLAPGNVDNFASYSTATQASTNTNVASYQVVQSADVAFNGANNLAGAADSDPLTVPSANAGSVITYNNYVWNLGNASDTFDVTIQSNTFPVGSTVQLFQQDGATTLINSAGTAAPDTGPVPGRNQACNPPFVTAPGGYCGYRVVVRVTLPASATGGPYQVVLRATSVFNGAEQDDMTNVLTTVVANTVDVTNDLAAPPAGAAVLGDGLGAGTTTIIRTNSVNPVAGGTTSTTFLIFVTNKGTVTDTFNLTSTPVVALPAGWGVAFRASSGGNCNTPGAVITATGPLAQDAAQLVCAVVTVPASNSGNASPGNYDIDFHATSQTNPAVTDVIRDRVTVNTVRSITLTPNNTQQTFPSGSVTYNHTITNAGNAADTATFAGGCLVDTRAGQGWTSAAYIDNGNGVLEVGTDTLVACGSGGAGGSLPLAVGESRTLFVRVFAPGSATGTDPANVTTLTATYSVTVSATDTTSVTDGLLLIKEQQAILPANCGNNNPPSGSYTTAAIPASPSTAPGACIAYRITATNTTAGTITNVVISDIVPPNTTVRHSCSGNGQGQPSVFVGGVLLPGGITAMVADGATGTLSATIPSLTSTQQATVYFCVQID